MINIKAARDILAKHGETYALYELEDIAGDAPADIEKTDAAYTENELYIIGDAINECDSIGKYGAGDLLFEIITSNSKYWEDNENE